MKKFILSVHGLGSEGEGVGYHDGYTLFVDGALPGETVEVEVFEEKKRYGRARLLRIVSPSPDRVVPPCKLFGTCGGCQLMHLAYPKQLEMKRKRVIDALTRIGKIEASVVMPCAPSPTPLAYRNKIQLPKQGRKLGLYAKNSHDLIEVETCHIHAALGDAVYRVCREILAACDALRHILIKTTRENEEALLILVTAAGSAPAQDLAERLMAAHPAIKGVVHNLHAGPENVILGTDYKLLAGTPYLLEKLCGLTFRVSPASFFQVNPLQAERLYLKALDLAELTGHETVLDAYCGVGTLSLIFAKSAKQVIGVEAVPQAIHDARENARLNGITNVAFIAASCQQYIRQLKTVDLALINPPRTGCDPAFLDGIGALKPKKLLYISCNPATLARDLNHLTRFGYRTLSVHPFDMFPQTAHVECIAALA